MRHDTGPQGSDGRLRRHALAVVMGSCLLFGAPRATLAFDTGPHASISLDALGRMGFSQDGQNAAQLSNWLTDYYTSQPLYASCSLQKLHFDDVFTTDDVAAYWAKFTTNAQQLARQRAAANDPVGFLVVLGMTLHVVQDFYSHSNWVEARTPNVFAYSSWFDAPRPSTNVTTGFYRNCFTDNADGHPQHGGYSGGPPAAMNHDSYVRPNYPQAYVYAYAASLQWTANMLDWAGGPNAAFVKAVKGYQASAAERALVTRDRQASLYISEWVVPFSSDPDHVDGHWNGDLSGNSFLKFSAYAVRWAAQKPESGVVRTFRDRKYFDPLSAGLYDSTIPAPPQPAMVRHAIDGDRVFMLVTRQVQGAHDDGQSFAGQISRINGPPGQRPYREAAERHRWITTLGRTTIMFAPRSQPNLELHYQVIDERSADADLLVSIRAPGQPHPTTLDFTCVFASATCAGDINGQAGKLMSSDGRKSVVAPGALVSLTATWADLQP